MIPTERNRARWALAAILVLTGCLVFAEAPQVAQKADPLGEEHLMEVMHSISSRTLFNYVKELCSDKYAGRLTGTPGYNAAAEWAIGLLKQWKIRPAGDEGTYLQKFPDPYTLVLPGGGLALRVPVGNQAYINRPYTFEQDFFPGSTSDSGEVTADVVYVGYGITAPELHYDEYAGVDVKGKLVLVEPEVPVSPDNAAEFKRWRPYSFHDYKVKNAKEHGAAGMVYDYHIANPNCAFVKGFQLTYVGRTVVDDLFAGTGRRHDDLLAAIRREKKPASFALGKTMTMKNVTEHHPEGIGSNVIALLEGKDPALNDEYIIVGAHLDHLGLNPVLMPGAIDNASADAVLLEVAEALATTGIPLRRSVLFILFGAEEQGVKGSEYYVAHPVVPNARVTAMINLESVGRGERINAGSGKNFPQVFGYFDRANRKYIHRPLTPGQNANLARPRQDAAHFLWAGIPTLSFGVSGGSPLPYATYHTSKDTPAVITPEIMEDLARLVFLGVVDLATATTAAGSRN
jgi:hypothetical protein